MQESHRLDTTSLKEVYSPEPTKQSDKFGEGELYKIGQVNIELFYGTEKASPAVRIRAPGATHILASVSEVLPQDDGLLINCALPGQHPHCSAHIGKDGSIAILYSPPVSMTVSENGVTRNIKGQEYIQTSIGIEGSVEGVRVQIKGVVDAAPRLVDAKNPRSPLTFFLIEEAPKNPGKSVYHEVWAKNRAKQQLKSLKLVKGDIIEAVLYRHIIDVDFIGGESANVTRHNLHTIIYVEKKERLAKRPKGEE